MYSKPHKIKEGIVRIINGHVMVTRNSALYGTWQECKTCGWEMINGVWYKLSDSEPSCEQSATPPECTDPTDAVEPPGWNL